MADITIHLKDDLKILSFHPDNKMCIRIGADGDAIALFGMDPARAWALFDLFRDEMTAFYYGDDDIHRLGDDPQRAAETVARARAESLKTEEAA